MAHNLLHILLLHNIKIEFNHLELYFLVLTRLFKNQSEIPEYVPNPTMKRMHDRMRAVVILTAFTLFYVISYTSEWRTRRQMDIDKASGKVVRTYADIKS
uniref:Uncharacterized protein n=1 Tax=Panagrolaimus superbus TaxID=310955 RepID=A0A914Z750_9BILA